MKEVDTTSDDWWAGMMEACGNAWVRTPIAPDGMVAVFEIQGKPALLCLSSQEAYDAAAANMADTMVPSPRIRGRDVFELAAMRRAGILFDPATHRAWVEPTAVTFGHELYQKKYGPSPELGD